LTAAATAKYRRTESELSSKLTPDTVRPIETSKEAADDSDDDDGWCDLSGPVHPSPLLP
jgi:hypothetical protein